MIVALTGMSAAKASGDGFEPVADSRAVVVEGNARFTILTPEMIRVEYSPSGKFEDRATFSVVNRYLPMPKFSRKDDGAFIVIKTDRLTLRYRKGTNPLTIPASPENLTITMSMNGHPVVWYPGLKDPMNLKGTYRTLDENNGYDYLTKLEEGVVSRSGWAVLDDSPGFKRADGSTSMALEPQEDYFDWLAQRADKDAYDVYFMGYGHDYKRALKDFTRISGKIPLPPDYIFGYWYSKYQEYSAQDFRDIANALQSNGIKTDVMILDMDWHYNGSKRNSNGRGGWTGWSWNRNLIPDPEGLLSDLHKSGLRTSLNLHPAKGVDSSEDCYNAVAEDMGMDPAAKKTVDWNLNDKRFAQVFFKDVIRPLERQGVDFWWLDWQQWKLNRQVPELGETMWCNYVFFNDMKRNRPDRRPVIFHRWGGLGSHRYQIGFSGDTYINYETLAAEPFFTSTASNVGYGYWGHDLGGHMCAEHDPNDPELLARWVQYGVFSPIFRTHATSDPRIERRIWTYSNFPTIRAAIDLRYALFPYFYTMARNTYDNGIGICRPLYYEHPERQEAYDRKSQYYFGDDILVAPIGKPSKNGISREEIWLPKGEWWSPAHSLMIKGDTVVTLDYTLDQYPYFIRRGAIIPMNPEEVKSMTERPERLVLNVIAGADGEFNLYEDEGDNADYDSVFAVTSIRHKHAKKRTELTILPVRGDYKGMPLSRAYTVRLYNTDEPSKAMVDGRIVKQSYDASSRCTTIEVPTAARDKLRKIVVL